MAEIKFAIKTLLIASAITMAAQYKYQERTLEDHAHQWLQHSATAIKMREVAKGAGLAVSDIAKSAKRFAKDAFTTGTGTVTTETQKASRLH